MCAPHAAVASRTASAMSSWVSQARSDRDAEVVPHCAVHVHAYSLSSSVANLREGSATPPSAAGAVAPSVDRWRWGAWADAVAAGAAPVRNSPLRTANVRPTAYNFFMATHFLRVSDS